MPRKLVRVSIDPQTCVGSQQCISVDPEHFSLGDEGWAQFEGVTIDEELAKEAADLCPVSAIELIYEETA